MKTIKFTIKNLNNKIQEANFNIPDDYEKLFDKYVLEAIQIHDSFGKDCMNFYFRNKITDMDEGSFIIKNPSMKELFQNQISNMMNKMLEKFGENN